MSQLGETEKDFKYLNRYMPRVDAQDKVTGRAAYAADLSFADMLAAGALYSPYASAKVTRIDTAKAEAVPGVVAVMTCRDLKKPFSWGYYCYMTDRIRYEGDAVAIVAAEDEQALKAGLAAIEVEYEPLTPVLTIEEALAPGAPLVHEESPDCAGNVWSHATAFVRKGDVDEAFKKCDRIVERTYTTGNVEHAYLETETAVAVPEKNGRMTVYTGCANPFFGRRWAADACGLPRPKIRLIQTTVGGSFGGKEELSGLVTGRAAMLAQKTGRPVKYVASREESFRCSTKRHPFRVEYKVGVNLDGKLQAVECRVTENCGAYHMHEWMSFRTKIHAAGAYNVPNVKIDIKGVFTNTVTSGAMRGYGSPQTIFAVEQLYEEVAKEIGMDALTFKKRNLLRQGDIHPCGQEMKNEIILPEMIDQICEKTGYIEKHGAYETQSGRIRKGIGMSICHRGCGLGGESPDNSACLVTVHDDGTVMCNVGLVEVGQGADDRVYADPCRVAGRRSRAHHGQPRRYRHGGGQRHHGRFPLHGHGRAVGTDGGRADEGAPDRNRGQEDVPRAGGDGRAARRIFPAHRRAGRDDSLACGVRMPPLDGRTGRCADLVQRAGGALRRGEGMRKRVSDLHLQRRGQRDRGRYRDG